MIKYNESTEVNEKQFKAVLQRFTGLVAHRTQKVTNEETKQTETKFFIKLWHPNFAPFVQSTLDEHEA